MRKVMMLVLCFVFLTSLAFGETGGESQTVYSVNLKNDTGEAADYLIPVTTIRPGIDKLWGYDCFTLAPTGESTETWITMFDSTDSTMSGECFGEKESNAYESISDRWVNGRKVVSGVAIRLGSKSEAQVYFIRK